MKKLKKVRGGAGASDSRDDAFGDFRDDTLDKWSRRRPSSGSSASVPGSSSLPSSSGVPSGRHTSVSNTPSAQPQPGSSSHSTSTALERGDSVLGGPRLVFDSPDAGAGADAPSGGEKMHPAAQAATHASVYLLAAEIALLRGVGLCHPRSRWAMQGTVKASA